MNVQGEPGSKGKGHGSLCPSMIACLPSRDCPPVPSLLASLVPRKDLTWTRDALYARSIRAEYFMAA